MESESLLIWAMVFGCFGLGFFTYGRRQHAAVPLVVGILLFVIPYFISSVEVLVLVGIVLSVLPFFVKV